jgi:regulator of replication initiation timing
MDINFDFHSYIDNLGGQLFTPLQITEIKRLFIYNPGKGTILVDLSGDTMNYIKSIPESALHVECVKQDSSELEETIVKLEATIVKLKADMQGQEKYISDSTIEKTHLKTENSKLLNEKTQCETAYASLYAQNNIIDTKYNELLQKLKEQFQLVGTSFTSFSDYYKIHSRTLHPDRLKSFKEQILTKCANVPDDFDDQFNNITVLSTRIGQLLLFLRNNNY